MSPTLQWLNDNWFQIVGPILIIAVVTFGGLWLRHVAFNALSQSHFRARWKASALVVRHLWQPFLHLFVLLGFAVAINFSILPSLAITLLNRVLLTFLVVSVAWFTMSVAVGLFLYHEIGFRKSLHSISSPQPPTSLIVNSIRALIALVAVLLLLAIWQGPDVSGLLALAAFTAISVLALHDATERRVSRRLGKILTPLRVRKAQKAALSMAAVFLTVDMVRRIALAPTESGAEQNEAVLWIVLEIAALIWAGSMLRRSVHRRSRPRFAVVALGAFAILFVPTMLGLDPIAGYTNMVVEEMRADFDNLEWQVEMPDPPSLQGGGRLEQVRPAVVFVLGEDLAGTGMVINDVGHVLTCWHVVEGCTHPRVIIMDDYYYDCTVARHDPSTDLALLVPDGQVSTPDVVPFGSASTVEPGDELWVMGYALGLEGDASITRGVASALRELEGVTYIQTDAPVNPGNSGGPIIDERGKVVAVASFKIADVEIEGMQFGVAIEEALPLLASSSSVTSDQNTGSQDAVGIEEQVVKFANEERQVRGTPMLAWDEDLARIASSHATEMASRGEMFHSSMYEAYAENCWMGSAGYFTAKDICQSWMQSEKHRTWLLCPGLEHVGIGIAVKDGMMFASWTFWRNETRHSDWWYVDGGTKPEWWY